MHILLPLAAGLLLLALFLFGGKVQGGGERTYIASAARAFLMPWVGVVALWLWIRFWSGTPFVEAALALLPGLIVPIIAAFLAWRHFRT